MSGPKEWQDGAPCNRVTQLGDPDGKCVFHTEMEKDAATFVSEFLRLVKEQGKKGVDATRFVFPTLASNEEFHFPGPMNFRAAAFTDDADFANATFTDDAHFTAAEFMGYARFDSATFTGEAHFTAAEFTADALFDSATFIGYTSFMSATFTYGADFNSAVFIDDARFDSATFTDDAFFLATMIVGYAAFRRAVFKRVCDWTGAVILPGGFVEFEEATIEAELRLHDIQIPRKTLNDWHLLVNARARFLAPRAITEPSVPDVRVDLRDLSLGPRGRIRLAGVRGARASGIEEFAEQQDPATEDALRAAAKAILGCEDSRRRMDVTTYRFAHTQVERFEFQNVGWEQLPAWRGGLLAKWRAKRARWWARYWTGDSAASHRSRLDRIVDEDFITNLPGVPLRTMEPEESEVLDASIVADAYRGIRASYERSLNYAEAGTFHRREMEMRRLSALHGVGRRRWGEGMTLTLYKWLGNYGESAARPLLWLIGLVCVAFAAPIAWSWWGGPTFAMPLGTGTGQATPGLLDRFMYALKAVVGERIATNSPTGFLVQTAGLLLVALFIVGLQRRYKRGSGGGKLA